MQRYWNKEGEYELMCKDNESYSIEIKYLKEDVFNMKVKNHKDGSFREESKER